MRPPSKQTSEEIQEIFIVVANKDTKSVLVRVSLSHKIVAMQSEADIKIIVVGWKDVENSFLEKYLDFNGHLID